MVVVARTGSETDTVAVLSMFLVDTDARGFEKQPIAVEMVAPEKQFSLFFDDVECRRRAPVGVEGDGLRQLFAG